jgi:hypothetical protein
MFGDLLQPPGSADPGLHARMLAVLGGEQAAEPSMLPPGGPLPDVTGLRAGLGL